MVGVAAAIGIPLHGNIFVSDRGDSTIDICDSWKRGLTYPRNRWPAWTFRFFFCGFTFSKMIAEINLSPRSTVQFFTPRSFSENSVNHMVLNHSQAWDPRSHIISSSPIWKCLKRHILTHDCIFFPDKVNLIFKFYFLSWSSVIYIKFCFWLLYL